MIWIILLEHADETFRANHINAFSRSVKKYVVTFTSRAQTGYFVPILGVEHNQHRRFAGHSEEPMVFLIERHCIVPAQALEWPLGNTAGSAIDGFHHIANVRHVNKNVISTGLNLE